MNNDDTTTTTRDTHATHAQYVREQRARAQRIIDEQRAFNARVDALFDIARDRMMMRDATTTHDDDDNDDNARHERIARIMRRLTRNRR